MQIAALTLENEWPLTWPMMPLLSIPRDATSRKTTRQASSPQHGSCWPDLDTQAADAQTLLRSQDEIVPSCQNKRIAEMRAFEIDLNL